MHVDERENQTAGAGRGLLGLGRGALGFGDRGVDLVFDQAAVRRAGASASSTPTRGASPTDQRLATLERLHLPTPAAPGPAD